MVYNKNQRNGKFTVYHPSGKTYIMGLYKNDLPSGFWTYFTDNGAIIKTIEFNEQGNPTNNEELKKLEDEAIRLREKNKGKIKEPSFESVLNDLYQNR